jgi:hypothetical protein
MTDILKLFRGVGVIIDDDLGPNGKSENPIWGIKESFEEKNIPILPYYELPTAEEVNNFNSVSFLLLDWKLVDSPNGEDDNIEFIKQFNEICFAPIFIFSNESPDSITRTLTDAGLYASEKKHNHILVKRKSELYGMGLFNEIEKWLRKTPSVYVLKEWDLSLQAAKNSLFWNFYKISPNWVKIFYETTQKDNTNFSYEMGELLFENLRTRCFPIDFDKETVSSQSSTTTSPDEIRDEIRQVLEGQCFKKDDTSNDMIFTGDVFFVERAVEEIGIAEGYYINVRPQCDCIPRENGQIIDDVKLYLIQGKQIDISKEKSKFNDTYGTFNDGDVKFTVFPIHDGKMVGFDLQELYIQKYGIIKVYRIGTLIPPFITKLVQKYAFCMERQGLPRIPSKAIK